MKLFADQKATKTKKFNLKKKCSQIKKNKEETKKRNSPKSTKKYFFDLDQQKSSKENCFLNFHSQNCDLF